MERLVLCALLLLLLTWYLILLKRILIYVYQKKKEALILTRKRRKVNILCFLFLPQDFDGQQRQEMINWFKGSSEFSLGTKVVSRHS